MRIFSPGSNSEAKRKSAERLAGRKMNPDLRELRNSGGNPILALEDGRQAGDFRAIKGSQIPGLSHVTSPE
jgi:hypothetical protein